MSAAKDSIAARDLSERFPELLQVKDVYIAAPFFNEGQLGEVMSAENQILKVGLEFYSPRLGWRYKPGDPQDSADKAFFLNKHHINGCKFLVACLSFPDMGTAWELGYANALAVPRIGVTASRKVGMNLMVRNTVDVLVMTEDLPEILNIVALDIARGYGVKPAIYEYANIPSRWEGEME
jgi:nucleoside 2-deoxyribosyltransferase